MPSEVPGAASATRTVLLGNDTWISFDAGLLPQELLAITRRKYEPLLCTVLSAGFGVGNWANVWPEPSPACSV